MRLTSKESMAILEVAKNVFGPDVRVKLFGSRTDDSKKGGDIDLLVLTSEQRLAQVRQLKFKFLDDLQGIIGEQRIDVVITTNEQIQKDEFLSSIAPVELKA
jgi:predicted nucleotidyltransferase